MSNLRLHISTFKYLKINNINVNKYIACVNIDILNIPTIILFTNGHIIGS